MELEGGITKEQHVRGLLSNLTQEQLNTIGAYLLEKAKTDDAVKTIFVGSTVSVVQQFVQYFEGMGVDVFDVVYIYTQPGSTTGLNQKPGDPVTVDALLGMCGGKGMGPFANIYALRSDKRYVDSINDLKNEFKNTGALGAYTGMNDDYVFSDICDRINKATMAAYNAADPELQKNIQNADTLQSGGSRLRQRGGGFMDVVRWIGGALKTAILAPFRLMGYILKLTGQTIASCAKALANAFTRSQIYQAVKNDVVGLYTGGLLIPDRVDRILVDKYNAFKALPLDEKVIHVGVFTLLCLIPLGYVPYIPITGTGLIYNLTTYLFSLLPGTANMVMWAWAQYALIFPIGVLEHTFFVELTKLTRDLFVTGTNAVKDKITAAGQGQINDLFGKIRMLALGQDPTAPAAQQQLAIQAIPNIAAATATARTVINTTITNAAATTATTPAQIAAATTAATVAASISTPEQVAVATGGGGSSSGSSSNAAGGGGSSSGSSSNAAGGSGGGGVAVPSTAGGSGGSSGAVPSTAGGSGGGSGAVPSTAGGSGGSSGAGASSSNEPAVTRRSGRRSATTAVAAAGGSGQGGGRRKTRKYHSRRHKRRRQSQRHKRRG
jgi:hypothetical protein